MYNSLYGVVGRYAVTGVDDSGSDQQRGNVQYAHATGEDGEAFTYLMRMQPHGFTSNPPIGSHMLGLAQGGDRDRLYLLGGEHPDYKPKDTPTGAAVLYDHKGNVIRAFGKDGIQVNAATGDVAVAAKTGNVSMKPASGKFLFLGGDGTDGEYDFVMTVSGPSSVVKAKL